MIAVIEKKLDSAEAEGKLDPYFVDAAVDFIRVYADRTHHGKEEEIMFAELAKKELAPEDQKVMDELVDEHVVGRDTTAAVVAANERYRNGDESALGEIKDNLRKLCGFYPVHIAKEDKLFFPSTNRYFTEEELDAMLDEFWEFDRKMIHEKYEAIAKFYEHSL
jgi:hemerythrin-like domain-containing protein